MIRLRVAVLFTAAFALMGAISISTDANAELRIDVKTKTYSVKGATGYEIWRSMLKRGPYSRSLRQRVWAVTSGKIKYSTNSRRANGSCRVYKPTVSMNIVYTMPEVKNRLKPKSAKIWKKMYQLLVVHEKVHGQIYTDLAKNAYADLKKLKPQKDCRKLRRKADSIVDRYRAEARKRNLNFDRRDVRSYRNMRRLTSRSRSSS